ncbi:hypothetical protein [Anaerotignum sp.]|uniref:hypothetical protein n=1 Tax=Anaerotignum sp. TaxID=2039241 RepID=UPI002714A2EB|nr:hypothetical protein [Anaerotignum sp.]
MKRKKEIVIFMILIPLLLFSFLRLGEYRFSAEGIFYAYERGLGYGPSEKILGEYELAEGGKLILGKWEGNLSAVTVKRAFGVLWKKMNDGIAGCYSRNKVVSAYTFNEGEIMGLSLNPEIREVYCRIEYGDFENPSIQEVTLPVNHDGLIWGEWEYQDNEDVYQDIAYLEGRNSDGEVIYRDGMTDEGIYYNDGTANKNVGKRE